MVHLRLSVALSYTFTVTLIFLEYLYHSFDITGFSFSTLSRNDQSLLLLKSTLPFFINPIAVIFGYPLLLTLSLFVVLAHLIQIVSDWWIPYFYGCCGKWEPSWENSRRYSQMFGSNIKLLPDNGKLVPDLHVTVQSVLLVMIFIFTFVAVFQVYKSKPDERKRKVSKEVQPEKPKAE